MSTYYRFSNGVPTWNRYSSDMSTYNRFLSSRWPDRSSRSSTKPATTLNRYPSGSTLGYNSRSTWRSPSRYTPEPSSTPSAFPTVHPPSSSYNSSSTVGSHPTYSTNSISPTRHVTFSDDSPKTDRPKPLARSTRYLIDPHTLGPIDKNSNVEVEKESRPYLEIQEVDLLISENSRGHHTDRYEMTEESYIDDITGSVCTANLIIRRGQEFKVKLRLNRLYGKGDKIRVEACFGAEPMVSKGTYAQVMVGDSNTDGWYARKLSVSHTELILAIKSPANCAVGKWSFTFDSVNTNENGELMELMQEPITCSAFILFNAWCEDDAVYLKNGDWADEYVLNDTGKVYRGSAKQIIGKPWNFGQFESVSLQAALFLLDEVSSLASTARGNPIILSRKLSALVNSQDDNGVLVGSWTGDYSTGTPPDSWSGSVAILKQYMQTKSSVKFGQCWVFAGVLTTVFRAIGIPARPVTNFLSAHDTDGSLTIDCHYNSDGEPLTELNRDSVWNFHVWTEAWMTRPDLKLGYGGWQAVDSTPQETSDGVYRAGPASVAAIKNGDVGTLYDTPFLFAEVNADRIHWFKMNDGRIQKQFEKDIVGKNISTKAIGWRLSSSPHFSDREDLTMQYKHPEGSTLERAAVWRASSMSTKPNMYSENENNNDVTIKIADVEDITFGNDFQLPVTLKNNSYAERTVNMMVSLYSIFYTGIICRKLKKLSFQCVIPANSAKQCMVPVSANDYINQMADHNYGMKINYVCSVLETKRVVAVQDDFVLTLPTPELVVSKKQVMIGGEFEVSISVRNPLKKKLTGCQFTFESAGNIKPTTVYASCFKNKGHVSIPNDFSDIPTNHSAAARCVVTAKRAGQCVLIASFLCDEMSSVQSQCDVEVLR